MLLATLMELFRDVCIREPDATPAGYGIDCAHFITAPSLSWAAMLFMNHRNGVVIENMTDREMHDMTRRGVRGGMCMVMNPSFERTDTRAAVYLDATNLYGTAMCNFPMPLKGYRREHWPELRALGGHEDVMYLAGSEVEMLDEDELSTPPDVDWLDEEPQFMDDDADNLDDMPRTYVDWDDIGAVSEWVTGLSREDPVGYCLEVDLHYPEDVRRAHNDYPLCPENKMCYPSPWTRRKFEELGMKMRPDGSQSGAKKLVSDLNDKRNYVMHYMNLKQCLSLGMVLVKVHRCFSFEQSDWLAPYIRFNTDMRNDAKRRGDESGKALFKLLNNSIYGKMVEDVMRRRNVKLLMNDQMDKALDIAARPNIKHWNIVIDDELLVVETSKKCVTLNRPILVGFAVLVSTQVCQVCDQSN